jgi:hypothetical protein
MESFWRRLRYYGIGFGIGLLFVFVFFQNRGCSWLPANRVKNSILDRLLVIPEDQEKAMKEKDLLVKDIVNALNEGNVEFSESKKGDLLKVYKILHTLSSGKQMTFYFTLPKESFVSEVHFTEPNAQSVRSSKKGSGRIIRIPKDRDLVFLEPDPILQCMVKNLFVKKEKAILKAMKTNGRIDFERTRFTAKPKAIQVLTVNNPSGELVRFEAIWYKNKVNITSMTSEKKVDCR